MAEETTTSTVSEDSQAQDVQEENPVDNRAQLEKDATTEAVEPSEDTSQTSEAESAEPVAEVEPTPEEAGNSDEDSEIRDWAEKKNLDLSDPLKIAKMYRESEKALGKKGQEQGQLNKAVSSANEEASVEDMQAMKNELAALNFKIDNNIDSNTEAQMVNILDERPWMAGDLDGVLLMARGQSAQSDDTKVLEARKAGGKEALATVAARERAAAPKSSASTRDTPPQFYTDAQVGEMSQSEYAEAKAAGKIPL